MPILGTIASQVPGRLLIGSFESIATATPNGSDVMFTSIPQGYKNLQVRAIARTTRNDASVDTVYCRFNEDAGNNYGVHILTANGSGSPTTAFYGAPTVLWGPTSTPTVLAASNMFSTLVIDIVDYSSSVKLKTTTMYGGSDVNGSGTTDFYSGLWRNTDAITSIRFFAEGNFANGSHFALYGIKG